MILEQSIADLIERGSIRRHVRKSWKHYKDRRDLCCELLQANMRDLIQFDKPAGGMAIWAQFDPRIDLQQLSAKARQRGLYLSDGSNYNPPGRKLNACRLGFASMDEGEIRRGVEILKTIMR